MGLSVALLSGCDQIESSQENPKTEIETELLRKNGNNLVESGKAEEAVIVFDKILESDPKNILAYNSKAIAFDHGGNHLAAQDIYQAALSIDPESLLIKNNLAMSLILNQQAKQAIEVLEPIVKDAKNKKSPHVSIIRHNLALAYGVSGQQEKATKLNLQDMNKEQAQENIVFYEKYSKIYNKPKSKDNSDKETSSYNSKNNIGFITTPPPPPQMLKKPDVPVKISTKNTVKPESKTTTIEDSTFFGKDTVYSYPK